MDTIFALSSGRPPAAIAVIRISGPRAFPAGERLAGTLPEPRQAVLRTLRGADGDVLDQALVLVFPAGASVTGEALVELHCHGGRAVVDVLLSELRQVEGLRHALPGEFTRQAFANGRMDLSEAEGLADLLEAETQLQRRSALAIAGGSVRRQVEAWREQLVVLSARAEAAIDYVGEDEEDDAERAIAADIVELRRELRAWLDQPRSELLRQGVRVVLAGPPNAGKSSLLNALAGVDRAIVTPVPGTTRDAIEVPLSLAGVPLSIVDTAGIRVATDEVERIGVELAGRQAEGADILCWLGAPADAPRHPRLLVVRSKADLPVPGDGPGLPVSSVTGAGLAELKQHLLVLASTLLPTSDLPALNRRQAQALEEAFMALEPPSVPELVLSAEGLRHARAALDRLTGRAGMEEVLDALFSRFCLGK